MDLVKSILRLVRNLFMGLMGATLIPALAFITVIASIPKDLRLADTPPAWITEFYALALVAGSLLGGYIIARLKKIEGRTDIVVFCFLWLVIIVYFWKGQNITYAFQIGKGIFLVLLSYSGYLFAGLRETHRHSAS